MFLGINLTKEVKNLYTELCKSLLREIKGDTNKSEDNPCSLTGRLDIVKVLKQDILVTNNHKKCSRSLIISEIEINIIIRYLFTPAKWAIKVKTEGRRKGRKGKKKLRRKGQKKNNVRTREFGRLVDC